MGARSEGFEGGDAAPLRVTAVVPTLDEEGEIAACLAALARASVDEIVLADGGSRDRTIERARRWVDHIVEERGGLFAQLNAGAEAASGDVILFHYADGRLGKGAVDALRSALSTPETVGGAFCLDFDSARSVYRLIALGANVRNRFGLGPFGDQSIFVRADLFREIGGFDERDPWADHSFARELRRHGRFRIIDPCVRTSVRRFEEQGVVRTLIDHWRASAACALGMRGARQASTVSRLRRVR